MPMMVKSVTAGGIEMTRLVTNGVIRLDWTMRTPMNTASTHSTGVEPWVAARPSAGSMAAIGPT